MENKLKKLKDGEIWNEKCWKCKKTINPVEEGYNITTFGKPLYCRECQIKTINSKWKI